MQASPVPTKMTLGSDSATAMLPIEEMGYLSKIGCQVEPASVVFQTPPATAPK